VLQEVGLDCSVELQKGVLEGEVGKRRDLELVRENDLEGLGLIIDLCGRFVDDQDVDRALRMLVQEGIGQDPGEAQIVVGESREAAMVPQDALQRYEGGTYIFVRDEPDLFSMRRITTGSFIGDQVEILEGLRTNEAVVVSGSFIVLSEALKWKMGAGCAGH